MDYKYGDNEFTTVFLLQLQEGCNAGQPVFNFLNKFWLKEIKEIVSLKPNSPVVLKSRNNNDNKTFLFVQVQTLDNEIFEGYMSTEQDMYITTVID